MRNSKRFLSLVVAALLTGSAFATSANAAKFTDVDVNNEALNDAVELLTALNVTKGTSDTTFGTEENVTRQQMAAFIYRMMKAGKSVEGGTNTTSFEDLDDPTFYFMVSWANSQGIIKGRSATSFDPKGGITLQDAYTMIVRALGYDDGTLAYPIGYISLAEDLGLDENLPSTLNYTDTLTRGNVAIILANMFYAETAEIEIKYDAKFKVVCPDHLSGCPSDCTHDRQSAVSTGSVPTEYHKTVAEAIFEVEKISQRVVATPNYSFEGFEKPDEDVEMIVLSKDYVEDYDDYDSDIGSMNTIEFSELGLDGAADDYFLSDIVMFVKEDEDGEYKIFGATAQGTKKTVAFEDVEFGTVSGTSIEKYYDGEEKEYKIINGKLTLDGTVTYLFDAPYSFTKDQEKNKYNAEFITLDSFDGDMEEEKYFVNYVKVDDSEYELDETIVGEYNAANAEWTYEGYLSQVFFGGLGEIDVYDCDGDGRPEYLFVKNYVVGTIDATEDEELAKMDYDLTLDAEELIIPTDTAIVEGEFEDEDIVLAYVNKDANYVKVAEVLTGKEATIATLAGDKYFEVSTGEKVVYRDGVAVVLNGVANLAATFAQYADENANIDFDDEATYYFTAGGKLVYVTGLATAINLNDNYVVVLEDAAYMTTAMVDGKLEKAYYIDIYNDGEIKSVKAKKITEDSSVWDEDLTPETGDAYDFTAYVNKLATAKKDKKDAWYFELIDFSINNDMKALHDKEEASNEFRGTSTKTEFVQKNGTLYSLAAAEKEDDSKLRGVYVKDYTQIIIRSLDNEGDEIVTLYGADNLPDIKEGTKFADVSYVLVNNTNSTSYENLAVFYGVAVDANGDIAEMEPSKGDIADVRVIKSYTTQSTEDGTLRVYDVFNPFKGTIETAIDGAEVDASEKFVKGDIVGLTTAGLIDDGVAKAGAAFGAGMFYDVDDDFEDIDNLGFLYVSEFDETTGYLEVGAKVTKDSDDAEVVSEIVDAIFQITDETVVSFADKSEETIKTVDADVLNSTSKTYKQGEEKKNATRVFLCVEEDEDNDDEDTLFYLVKFAMIVRD